MNLIKSIARISVSAGVIAALALSNGVIAEPVQAEIVEIETFTPAKPMKKKNPRYPITAQRKRAEGWVVLNYMVDPNGVPYEIEATAHAGHPSFVDAAKKAAMGYRYEPAYFNGTPIHTGAATRISFRLAGDIVGARRKFSNSYRAFFDLLESGVDGQPLHDAMHDLKQLDISFLYEDAFVSIASVAYAERLGDYESAQASLSHALRYQQDFELFSAKRYTHLQTQLFSLQARAGNLADALHTWAAIEPRIKDLEEAEKLHQAVTKIKSLQAEGAEFSATGTVSDHYRYSRKLLASAFSFADVDGDLAESKLYCDQGFLGFAIKPDVRYDVRNDYENCSLVVIGDPGTTFTITEHWSEVDRNT